MGWRMDSTAGAAIYDTEAMYDGDLQLRNEEIEWLAQKGRHDWKLINGRLAKSGHPTMALGYYSALAANPVTQAQTSVPVTTATPGTSLWTSTIFSPLLANQVVAGSAYRIEAGGTVQSSTSGLTLTILPSIGSGTVNVAPTNHQDLGVSGAAALGSTLTSIWYLHGTLAIRSVGTAGTAWFNGLMQYGNTAAPVASGASLDITFGGTSATVDFTGATASVPGGLLFSGWGAATVTVVTQMVVFQSL